MTTYNTGNPIGSTDARDLYDNAQNLDNFASGTAASYSDRLGVSRRTLAGIDAAADNVLNSIGYAVPVAYTAGISLTLTSQTVDYNGVVYAPKSSALPFTTSSWGTDAAKFRAIQVTDADLITYTPAGTGAVATTVQSKLRKIVSVKDFGAVGDGVADDTAAIRAAIAYALAVRFNGNSGIYGSGTFFVASLPTIHFPTGVYKVTDYLTPDVNRAIANYEFTGERSIIVADAGVTVFGGCGYNVNFSGLTFRGGACAVSIKTANLDTVRISISNCEFHEQTESCVRTDATSQSSIINITNSKFIQTIANNYIFEFLSGDVINIDNCWITANSNNQAAFYVGAGIIANMTDSCLVPWGDFVSPAPDSFVLTGRWFDFYGLNLRCRNVRFGGEGGGAPIVYNFTNVKTSTSFPWIYSTIVLDACEIPCNLPTNRVDAGVIVAKSGLPSVIRIVGCRGKTNAPFIYDGLTSGTLAAYLSSYETSATQYAALSIEIVNNISRDYSLTNDATASGILEKYGKRSSASQTGNRDFFAAIECKRLNGDLYSQTGASGTTSIVDTGITASAPLVGYGVSAVYDIVVAGNFNSAGSGSYRDTQFGMIAIGTGSFTGTQTSVTYTKLAQSTVTAVGSLTISAVFWDGATESASAPVNSLTHQLRIKIAGYAGTVGSQQTVRLVKRN